jgi:hypothetical protein
MSKPLRSIRLTPKSDYARFTGSRGEIFYDPVNNTLRVFNSSTVSGEILATRSWVLANSSDFTVDSIRSENDINIDINVADSTLQRWRFGEDGELTFPDGTSQSTAWPGSITALANLDGLSFKRGVAVAEFSTDTGFTDNATDTVPTEAAIRGYIDRRLGLTHTGEVVSQLNKIGPTYLTNNEFFILLQQSSSSINADEDRTIDAFQSSLSAYTASFTATRTLRISNLIQGRMVTVYVRNTNGSSRTINVEASDTEEDFVSVNMSRGAGQTSVTSITLAATSGTAVITVFGANGEICGFVN